MSGDRLHAAYANHLGAGDLEAIRPYSLAGTLDPVKVDDPHQRYAATWFLDPRGLVVLNNTLYHGWNNGDFEYAYCLRIKLDIFDGLDRDMLQGAVGS